MLESIFRDHQRLWIISPGTFLSSKINFQWVGNVTTLSVLIFTAYNKAWTTKFRIIDCPIEFTEDRITLDFPYEEFVSGNWKLKPDVHPVEVRYLACLILLHNGSIILHRFREVLWMVLQLADIHLCARCLFPAPTTALQHLSIACLIMEHKAQIITSIWQSMFQFR